MLVKLSSFSPFPLISFTFSFLLSLPILFPKASQRGIRNGIYLCLFRTASGGPEGSKSGESGNSESKGTPETGGSVGPETGGGESGDPEIGGSAFILEKEFSYSAFSSFIRHVYGDKVSHN